MCLDGKDILNLSSSKVGSVLSRFRTVVLIFMVVLALAGRCARKTRHVFEGFVNGLNLVVTSTMCFVIIATHPQVAEERISLRIETLIYSAHLIQVQLFLLRVAKEGRGTAERNVNKKRAEIVRFARKMGGWLPRPLSSQCPPSFVSAWK